jgi:hypothetical protein
LALIVEVEQKAEEECEVEEMIHTIVEYLSSGDPLGDATSEEPPGTSVTLETLQRARKSSRYGLEVRKKRR